jgi:hypothetical protein
MATSGKSKAEKAGDSAPLKALARVGLIAYGVVHVLIGWLALQLAWGDGPEKSADPSGAFTTLAEQPLGNVLLWLVVVGLVALSLCQASEVIWGNRDAEGLRRLRKRLTSTAFAAIYTALAASSASVAAGSRKSSSQTQQEAAVGVLGWPGGQAIVVASGLIVIGAGVVAATRGVRKSFCELIDLSSLPSAAQRWVIRLGLVGYVTRGIAFGLVGGLFSYAAWTFDVEKASGLDGALQTVLQQPFGRWLLSTMAFGFVAYGIFAILQFRYRRM